MPDETDAPPTAPVSIVVVSHDQAGSVGHAVGSALGQTLRCAVIAVDDGSSDGSPDAVRSAGLEPHRFSHRGAVETFRAGADLVETPFFLKLDGDDWLEPTFVERTLPAMTDATVGFAYTAVRFHGARTGISHPPAFDRRRLLWGNYAHGSSLMRTEAYRAVGGYSWEFERALEDWALWVDMVAAGWRGQQVDEPLLNYVVRAGSRNATDRRDFAAARWRMLRRHPHLYGATGLAHLVGAEIRDRAHRALAEGVPGARNRA